MNEIYISSMGGMIMTGDKWSSERNLFHCYCVHHRSHMPWCGMASGVPWCVVKN